MARHSPRNLSRRERQIMDIVYRRGRATAAEVRADLSDPPSYSAVRALLAILVNKELLRIEEEGPRYVYLPTQSPKQAGRTAIRQVVKTFFAGSVAQAVTALIEEGRKELSDEEARRLKALIEEARKEERHP